MCGFLGFTGGLYDIEDKKKVLNNMLSKIIHRGPDSCGIYCDEYITVGFRRLAIVDTSENGDQPFFNKDKSIMVVFNGEIYNYTELKNDLEKHGHKFVSKTDTEILVHGYEEYGEEVISKLRGMFSFAIWELKNKKLLLARDIFGMKPLYYTKLKDGGLLFGSEIKSFLEHPLFEKALNEKALKPFLTFQYNPMSETFFKGVFKLLPSHYIIMQNDKISTQRYYSYSLNTENMSEKSTVRRVDKIVCESIDCHKTADVEYGVLLSGGVDSSYVACKARPEKVFSVGFNNVNFDETEYAREFSSIIHSRIYTKYLEAEECFNNFDKMQYYLDEPSANPSIIPLYFLAKLASKHVKVVMSGEGADELFGGYEAYLVSKKIKLYRILIPKFLRKFIANFAKTMLKGNIKTSLIRGAKTEDEDYIGHAYIFDESESAKILNSKYNYDFSVCNITNKYYAEVKDNDSLVRKIYLDLNLWLPGDILLKADKMSMAHSIELRVPFLDKKVFEFASTIPSKLKIKGKQTKYILRKAAKLSLPEAWAKRPKKGFPVPIAIWLKDKKYYEQVKEVFTTRIAAQFFESTKIIKLLNEHYEGKYNNARKIWTIYTFLIWYNEYFVKR